MSAHPRVSIGMPVYNGERFVGQAIDSLLCQSYSNFELLVSDNASTDGTYEICRRLAALDSRIVLSRNPSNLGAAANFDRVFRMSQGEYFKWACADDVCDATLVQHCVDVLDADADVVLCYGRTIMVDEQGRELERCADGLDLQSSDVHARFARAGGHFGRLNVLQGLMRAAKLRETRRYGNYLGSDLVLMVELSLRGKLVELPLPLLYRRMHPGAAASSATDSDRLAHLDPTAAHRHPMIMWRLHCEQSKAVWLAPLSLVTRSRLELAVLISALRQRERLWEELRGMMRHARRRASPESANSNRPSTPQIERH